MTALTTTNDNPLKNSKSYIDLIPKYKTSLIDSKYNETSTDEKIKILRETTDLTKSGENFNSSLHSLKRSNTNHKITFSNELKRKSLISEIKAHNLELICPSELDFEVVPSLISKFSIENINLVVKRQIDRTVRLIVKYNLSENNQNYEVEREYKTVGEGYNFNKWSQENVKKFHEILNRIEYSEKSDHKMMSDHRISFKKIKYLKLISKNPV